MRKQSTSINNDVVLLQRWREVTQRDLEET